MARNAWVYVDGFNLYYGAVKDTPYKWLDIRKLCELLLPEFSVGRIKYFTARVSPTSLRASRSTYGRFAPCAISISSTGLSSHTM
jgi:hypothetical protein